MRSALEQLASGPAGGGEPDEATGDAPLPAHAAHAAWVVHMRQEARHFAQAALRGSAALPRSSCSTRARRAGSRSLQAAGGA